MSSEIAALRDEIAALRRELATLRAQPLTHHQYHYYQPLVQPTYYPQMTQARREHELQPYSVPDHLVQARST